MARAQRKQALTTLLSARHRGTVRQGPPSGAAAYPVGSAKSATPQLKTRLAPLSSVHHEKLSRRTRGRK